MKQTIDLSQCSWTLAGWTPDRWRDTNGMETGVNLVPEIPRVPAQVPGSVQKALLDAGFLPDWNLGNNSRACEWVENRHWIYETELPDFEVPEGASVRLKCLGLDYSGWVLLNGEFVGEFKGSFVPHVFDLTGRLKASENRLSIVFDCPPRWLGQSGFTSRITEWKPRYNYFWDWTARLVQLGIWDGISIEVVSGVTLGAISVTAVADPVKGTGTIRLQIATAASDDHGLAVRLNLGGGPEVSCHGDPRHFRDGTVWDGLPIELWHPNGNGIQRLYKVTVELMDETEDEILEVREFQIGFKHVAWRQNQDAPDGAEPWICVINGLPTFLQGVNWTPILPNFADVTREDYRRILEQYRELGVNLLRVWGGAFLEKSDFYELCDELGLLVWQELPLSSSGLDNWPPEDEQSVVEMEVIARSYAARRKHHASLLLWCGGNELQGGLDGAKVGVGKPIDLTHPMMARMAQVFEEVDPGRRFLPSSASGPRFMAFEPDFGQGLHHDVHGPWTIDGSMEDWNRYWANDDSLFRSETGSPGASSADIIRRYAGDCEVLPGTLENPLWRRTSWWIEWDVFVSEIGRAPETLEEYVAWSQERQAVSLATAARACKRRFPRCGGFLVWMGHDSFPCTANTAIIDFWGRPKPAALALAKIFREISG